jgi:uncharacterized SAM-binding protein YcdF (DUF218 family)
MGGYLTASDRAMMTPREMRLTIGLQTLGALVVSLLLVGAFTPAVNLLAYWRAPARVLGPVDAIVVLGEGGITESGRLSHPSLQRITEAIDLYRQGLAPLLVVSGSPSGVARTETEARVQIARASGIAPEAVLALDPGRTTHEEAQAVRALLEPRGARRIILVTDGASMARSVGTFEKVGFTVTPSYGVPILRWGGGPGARLRLLQENLIEMLASAYYRIQGWT